MSTPERQRPGQLPMGRSPAHGLPDDGAVAHRAGARRDPEADAPRTDGRWWGGRPPAVGSSRGTSAPSTASDRFDLPIELQNTSGTDFTGNHVAIAGARAAEADWRFTFAFYADHACTVALGDLPP